MTNMKLTLATTESGRVDLAVTAPAGVTVGTLARALTERDPVRSRRLTGPVTLAVHDREGSRALDPSHELEHAGISSGMTVSLRPASPGSGSAAPVVQVGSLRVLEGPDKGRTFTLHSGSNLIGRDQNCTVVLSDTQVSKVHAIIHIGSTVEIRDVNSTNGVRYGGGLVTRATLRADDRVQLGDTTVVSVTASTRSAGASSGTRRHNRSPRLDPPYEGVELEAPAPPKEAVRRRFPLIPMLTPLIMGTALYMLTKSPFSLIFIFMSPLMVGGAYAEDLVSRRREYKAAKEAFKEAVNDLDGELKEAAAVERVRRNAAHPSTAELVTAAHAYGPLLWTRRPEHASFLELRAGLSTLPSRNTVKLPRRDGAKQDVWDQLKETVARYRLVEQVPVVMSLRDSGALGVVGEPDAARRVARGVIGQLITLHSPAEVVLCAIMSTAGAERWKWLKWLPHTSPYPLSTHTPLRSEHLSQGGASAAAILAQLDEQIAQRSSGKSKSLPRIVVLVSDDTDADRGRLVDLAERGPEHGIHFIWLADQVSGLPAVCRTFVEVVSDGTSGEVGYVRSGERVQQIRLEPLSGRYADDLAMRLAAVVDAGARIADESDLPRVASFVRLEGSEVDSNAIAVLDRWREARPGLHAMIGALGANQPYPLDLVAVGPHALLGGTTGAGKSELLQTWLLGMAVAHDPRRVNFLLVDYKGGSAFGQIEELPHAVGMVTDLNPHLVRRVLMSLRAELTTREKTLESFKAKDLAELERHHLRHAPPRLVIVVDEFAALKTEIPEFVDGVVDIAQRGRSLGLHLILATQRPTGVINEQLKANTNLRIALRMADAGDSMDVLGTPQAAAFPRDVPGRAAARTGPGQVVNFQAAYVGGWTNADTDAQAIVVQPMPFGRDQPWLADYAEPDNTRTDIARIVETIKKASQHVDLSGLTVPWRPEVKPLIDIPRRDDAKDGPGLVFGIRDLPREQAQPHAVFAIDAGNLLVFGAGGSGKSTLLRTLAVAAARGDAGPCHLYGIDFGNRGLDALESLPHVAPIVRGDDVEQMTRLLNRLLHIIRQRSAQLGGGASISTYWSRLDPARQWEMPRILVLVDSASAFYQQYPPGTATGLYERLVSVATGGRQVGVHLAMTSDRPNAVPGSLSGTAPTRIVLRLAGEGDYNLMGIRSADALAPDAPPGRGLLDRAELQVAIAGGSDLDAELHAIKLLADSSAAVPPAPAIRIMPDQVHLAQLRDGGDTPLIGIDYETLEAVGFTPRGFFTVTGQASSGRTTTMRTMAASLSRARPQMPLILISPRPSTDLSGAAGWARSAVGTAKAGSLVASLTAELATAQPHALFIEAFPDFADDRDLASRAELLLKVCRDSGHFVVVEGDSTRMMKSDSLLSMVRTRNGIGMQNAPALQFSTLLGFDQAKAPKLVSPPPGRGLLVSQGQPRVVQIALPE